MAQIHPRRRFVHGLLAVLATFATSLLSLPRAWAKNKIVSLPFKDHPDLNKVGGSKQLKVDQQKLIIVRASADSVVAFDPTCTHKKCNVRFAEKTNKFHCKCHKSAFDLEGNVLGGPAPKPLTRFKARIADDAVQVLLPESE